MAENDQSPFKALESYPINEMILSLAKGISKAQQEMDKQSLEVLRERAAEKINNDADAPSLLELGLFPAFFTFDETIIDISIEISMYEGDSTFFSAGAEISGGRDTNNDGGSGNNAGKSSSTSVMFGASVNLEKSRKYDLDMTGATRMTTTVLSGPPPKRLLEFFDVEVD